MADLVGAQKMRDLAKMVSKEIPGIGFSIIVFPFHQKGIANYISNAQRADMIVALEGVLSRWKNNDTINTPEEQ